MRPHSFPGKPPISLGASSQVRPSGLKILGHGAPIVRGPIMERQTTEYAYLSLVDRDWTWIGRAE